MKKRCQKYRKIRYDALALSHPYEDRWLKRHDIIKINEWALKNGVGYETPKGRIQLINVEYISSDVDELDIAEYNIKHIESLISRNTNDFLDDASLSILALVNRIRTQIQTVRRKIHFQNARS